MADLHKFEQLIRDLMSEDNFARQSAENAFLESQGQPEKLITSLIQIINSSSDENVREESAILLRAQLGGGERSLWPKLNATLQDAVKKETIQLLGREKNLNVLKKICNVVSVLAVIILNKRDDKETSLAWPEIFQFMLNWTQKGDDNQRAIAMHLFAELTQMSMDSMKDNMNELKVLFANGVRDQCVKVRIPALNGLVSLLIYDPSLRNEMTSLFPSFIEIVTRSISMGQDEDALAALSLMVEMAESTTDYLRPHMQNLMDSFLQIMKNEEVEDSVRHMAAEVLITTTEGKPSMIRKMPNFLPQLLPALMEWAADIDDNENWNLGEAYDLEDVSSEIALEGIDRMSVTLGGNSMVPVLYNLIPVYLQDSNWKRRYVGLMALAVSAEGCTRALEQVLEKVVEFVIPMFRDVHPRVRWAACNAIGQLAIDFIPTFQQRFHEPGFQSLMLAMDDSQNPRVQAHASAAVINICNECEVAFIQPVLNNLLSKLAVLLRSNSPICVEQAITAIAAIAECIQGDFVHYYETFAPYMVSVLKEARQKELRRLRGKALEAIGIFGVAVGKELFLKYARDVLDVMVELENSNLPSDDPQIVFLQQTWTRIAKILKEDFRPYLSAVMPRLLDIAKQAPPLKILEYHDNEKFDETWEVVPIRDKKLAIHTSVLEEKAEACATIFTYCKELGKNFFPYIEEVCPVFVPFLGFYYHGPIRAIAAEMMPQLLTCTKEHFENNPSQQQEKLGKLWNFILPTFIKALEKEIDLDILLVQSESFASCTVIAGQCLSAENLRNVSNLTRVLVGDFVARRDQLIRHRTVDPDFDEEESTRLNDSLIKLGDFLSNVGDIAGKLAKSHGPYYLPIFLEYLDLWTPFLEPEASAQTKQVALCVCDDIIEYCGSGVLEMYRSFVPVMLNYASDEDVDVRQAAIYGVGVAAEKGGNTFVQYIPEALTKIHSIISHPDAVSKSYVHTTENAIAALGRLIIYQKEHVNLNELIPFFVQCLPLKNDKVEARKCHEMLIQLLATQSAVVVGENFKNLPRLLMIFAEVIGSDLVNEVTNNHIKQMLEKMRMEIPGNILEEAWNRLSDQTKLKLQKAASN